MKCEQYAKKHSARIDGSRDRPLGPAPVLRASMARSRPADDTAEASEQGALGVLRIAGPSRLSPSVPRVSAPHGVLEPVEALLAHVALPQVTAWGFWTRSIKYTLPSGQDPAQIEMGVFNCALAKVPSLFFVAHEAIESCTQCLHILLGH